MGNLERFKVVNLTEKESLQITGGIVSVLGRVIGALIAHVALEVMYNPHAHIDAFNEGYESGSK